MKTKLLNIIIALLFIPIALNATEINKLKHEKSKSIKKEYKVSSHALLKIDNRYGNVDVTSWESNRVVIEVKITVSGNDEDKVLKRLDMIEVEFDANSNEVSAKTVIQKKSSGWSWSWWRNNNVNYQIDYKIKVPIENSINLKNDYGNISLNEINGDAKINCDYGKIIIGELHSDNNEINIDYTNDSSIGLMNGGSINADYSKFTIEEAGDIRLNADYTTSVFENVKNLNYNCDYGSLRVDKASSVVGNGDYLSVKLGTISEEVKMEADYGSVRIEKLLDGFAYVSINSDYAGVKIGIPKNSKFNFELQLGYAGFKRDDNLLNFTKQIVKNSSKYYEGFVNGQNSSSFIKINSEYGGVTFF